MKNKFLYKKRFKEGDYYKDKKKYQKIKKFIKKYRFKKLLKIIWNAKKPFY